MDLDLLRLQIILCLNDLNCLIIHVFGVVVFLSADFHKIVY